MPPLSLFIPVGASILMILAPQSANGEHEWGLRGALSGQAVNREGNNLPSEGIPINPGFRQAPSLCMPMIEPLRPRDSVTRVPIKKSARIRSPNSHLAVITTANIYRY